MTPMNALFHRATTCPDGTAFIYDDVVWTYHDLLTGAEQLSRAFLARGVRPEDRVVLHMQNRPEMAVALYACFVCVFPRRSYRVPDQPAVQDQRTA
jgi:long-chain acyl-CoA synthetase